MHRTKIVCTIGPTTDNEATLGRLMDAGMNVASTLMLSDVIGNCLDVIASGPTVADTSTFREVKELLGRYEIWDDIPASVRRHISRGLNGELPDTPKAGDDINRQRQ